MIELFFYGLLEAGMGPPPPPPSLSSINRGDQQVPALMPLPTKTSRSKLTFRDGSVPPPLVTTSEDQMNCYSSKCETPMKQPSIR